VSSDGASVNLDRPYKIPLSLSQLSLQGRLINHIFVPPVIINMPSQIQRIQKNPHRVLVQNREKPLLSLSGLSTCPSVRIDKLDSRWTDFY